MTDERELPEVTKDPAESRPVIIEFFAIAANLWRANEPYTSGEFVRPNKSSGYAYSAGADGLSGFIEPVWPRVAGQTVSDGSISWTTVAPATNGISVISAPTVTSDPAGLTISAVSVSENTKVLATYSGGTEGQDYDAVFTVTLQGIPRVRRQKVKVRKR